MSRLNWSSQTSDYRGVLRFAQVTDQITSTVHIACDIPLNIKSHPIPVRHPRTSDIYASNGSSATYDTSYLAMFYGAPDPLQVDISGNLLTPVNAIGVWTPTNSGASTGTGLNLSNHSYGDIITAYVEGRMQRNAYGRGLRVDPYQYIDPWGNVYTSPKIMSYEFSYTATTKKQTFQMTLWLESDN